MYVHVIVIQALRITKEWKALTIERVCREQPVRIVALHVPISLQLPTEQFNREPSTSHSSPTSLQGSASASGQQPPFVQRITQGDFGHFFLGKLSGKGRGLVAISLRATRALQEKVRLMRILRRLTPQSSSSVHLAAKQWAHQHQGSTHC